MKSSSTLRYMMSTRRQTLRSPHIHEPVVHQQVSSFNEFRANLVRQKHVLVEGGIIHAGRQQGDRGIGSPPQEPVRKEFQAGRFHSVQPRELASCDTGAGSLS